MSLLDASYPVNGMAWPLCFVSPGPPQSTSHTFPFSLDPPNEQGKEGGVSASSSDESTEAQQSSQLAQDLLAAGGKGLRREGSQDSRMPLWELGATHNR